MGRKRSQGKARKAAKAKAKDEAIAQFWEPKGKILGDSVKFHNWLVMPEHVDIKAKVDSLLASEGDNILKEEFLKNESFLEIQGYYKNQPSCENLQYLLMSYYFSLAPQDSTERTERGARAFSMLNTIGTNSVKNARDTIAPPSPSSAGEEAEERSSGNNDQATAISRTDQSSQTNCMHGAAYDQVCCDFMEAFRKLFLKGIEGVDVEHPKLMDYPKDCLEVAHIATMDKFAEVWEDFTKMQMAISFSLHVGTNCILQGNSVSAQVTACFVRYFEEHIAVELKQTRALYHWPKIYEASTADMHTLVKFFSKRTPCSCLDEKYKEVKGTTKMSVCYNPQCTIPHGKVDRSKIMCCGRCQSATYCSRQCQKSHWRAHKPSCNSCAEVKAEFEAKQQNM